jgi:hypothetical protein
LSEALLQWRRQTDDPLLDREFMERMLREGSPASRGKKG